MNDDVTQQLRRFSDGDRQALDAILPVVYSELSRIASRYLRKEPRAHTLQTSALVHEAYLKLIDQNRVQWRNRSHFFAISSRIMRRLLVDHARGRGCTKRGGATILLALDEALVVGHETDPAVLTLHSALVELATVDPELAQVVELRFFGGLDNEEIAERISSVKRSRSDAGYRRSIRWPWSKASIIWATRS